MRIKIANPSQPYTLPSRSKSQPHEPKLVKEYGCPNTQTEIIAAKMKGK